MLHQPISAFVLSQVAPCPNCGGATLCASPQLLTKSILLLENEELVLEAFWAAMASPKVDYTVSVEVLARAIFDGEVDGGPEPAMASKAVRVAILGLRRKLKGRGYTIEGRLRSTPTGNWAETKYRLLLTPDRSVPDPVRQPSAGKSRGYDPRQFAPVKCSVCSRMIAHPTAEQVWQAHGLQPMEREIFRVLEGAPYRTANQEYISTVIYSISGYREPKCRRNAFKTALCNAEKKLAGSGMCVQRIGNYRKSYCLVHEVGP